MRSPRLEIGWLSILAGLVWIAAAPAQPIVSTPSTPGVCVPLDQVPARYRERMRRIVDKPTLSASAPAEEFNGRPALYRWLLDHPDRAAVAWRRLGTPCLDIADRGNGRFGWADDQGTDLYWETVYDAADVRIWYAEGRMRPGPLLPLISVYAVAILHHTDSMDAVGKTRVRHQADLYLYTDSKSAALVARLMGPTAPRMTVQGAEQLQFFFSALTRYLDRHPERAETLLFGPRPLGKGPQSTGDPGEVVRGQRP
jgi:hypothetical protein